MLIRIADNHDICLDQVDTSIDRLLFDHFSARHPRIRFIDVDQCWDGYYRKYDSAHQKLALPFFNELKELCRKNNIPYNIVDDRPPPQYSLPNVELVSDDMLSGITLEKHQIDAIKTACKEEIGILSMPTGAGKTEVMAGIAKMYNSPTVIIADKRIIIEQIKARLELRDVIEEAGLFYGGATPNGQLIVIGSIQSMSTPPITLKRHTPDAYAKRLARAREFQDIVKKADLLMVDECDQATSKNHKLLFRYYFNGRRRYGFSGTPFDKKKPVESLILREHLGSIISTADRRELESIGRIIPIKFFMFSFGEDGDPQDKTAYDVAEREIIIENEKFHHKILQIVQAFPNDGTLILIDTNNVKELGCKLEELIPNSSFIYGETPTTKRRECITNFEKRTLKCLIGGKIVKRGLDLAGGVENLILIGGGKLWTELDQKVGRAVRNNTRGWSRVFCFMFLNNYYLYKHSREQLKAVTSLGYQAQVIYSGGTVDGDDLIKRQFKIPKGFSKAPRKNIKHP